MSADLEKYILNTLSEYGSMEYDDLIDLIKSNYCANYQTIRDSVFWLYCQGKIEIHKPNKTPFYANLGEITIKEPVTS